MIGLSSELAKPSIARGLATAYVSPRQKSGVLDGSQYTAMVEAMKYGTQVMTNEPVVSSTILIAFHLLGWRFLG